MSRKKWPYVILLLSVLVAARGIAPALFHGKLITGHDTSAYAIYLTEFHDNLRSGNLFPTWAADLRYGHGEPHLGFRPPLQLFVTEILYLISGHAYTAISLTILFLVISCCIAMYVFLRSFSSRLSAAIGASGYILAPYFLRDLYIRGALSEAFSFLAFPILGIFIFRLGQKPNAKNFIAYAFSWAALSASHAGVFLISAPFFILGAIYASFLAEKGKALRKLYAGGFLLGISCSSFYWLNSLIEQKHVASALLAVDFESYYGHFKTLPQLLFSSIGAIQSSELAYNIGEPFLLTIAVAVALRLRGQLPKSTAWLLIAIAVSLYFMHRLSAFWFELIPYLQVMSFPWRFLTVATFLCAALLAAVFQQVRISNRAGILAAATFILLFGYFHSTPKGLSNFERDAFTAENIQKKGWGWAKPYAAPTTSGFLPTQSSDSLLDFVRGRGEAQCIRNSPTRIHCDVMAIQPATVRFNVLDYPGWTIRGSAGVLKKETEPFRGRIFVDLDAGKQTLTLEFKNTAARWATRILSVLCFMTCCFIVLAYRNSPITG